MKKFKRVTKMKIIVSDKLQAWMYKKKRKVIKIWIQKISSGWVGSISELSVHYEIPKDLEKYNHYLEKGIDFYIAKNIKTKNDEIKISVKRSLFLINELDIQGVELKM